MQNLKLNCIQMAKEAYLGSLSCDAVPVICQVLQSLPRLVRDVEAVRAEAARLREQMSVAKADIVKVGAGDLGDVFFCSEHTRKT